MNFCNRLSTNFRTTSVMRIKQIVLTLFLAAMSSMLWAQKTTIFTEADRAFKHGLELFDKGIYGAAQQSFQQTIDLLLPVNETESNLLKTQAKLYVGRCAVRQGLPDSEKIMLDFIREAAPDPASNQALIELANYYFSIKDYARAVQFYGQAPSNSLTREELSEVKFKMGYAYFAQKQFGLAKKNFNQIKGIQDKDYYYPTNYYLGLINFYEGKYSQAISNFKIVERDRSKKYKSVLPYYLTQIYFSEGRYDELLEYAIPKLNQGVTKNQKEINQLIGQTYFEREQYSNALPYLERYAESSSKMREEEFYQLGVVYLENNQPRKAIKYFEELTNTDSELGQNALYNLGRLYLQIGNKKARNSARNAFGAAARMQYDQVIQDDALFNYAKLSYELKYERDAISALRSITTDSRHYTDAQALMSKIFLDTRDYERAIATIKGLNARTPELREALQKVTYYRAVQFYNAGNLNDAKQYFEQSLEDPVDPTTKALAIYWLGDIAHQEKDYNESSQLLNQFLTLARPLRLPEESALYTANYILGYNYLRQDNYTGALGYFEETLIDIRRRRASSSPTKVEEDIKGDATLRLGDCLFKGNRYDAALRYYNEAIQNNYPGFVYALYQKAIIQGLQGRDTDKIVALENLVNKYPRSEYADDALLQLGVAYQSMGELNRAVGPLEILVRDYGKKSDLVNQALIQLGLVKYNQRQLNEAVEYYKKIFSNNPEPNEAQAALRALEEIYVNDMGNPDAYLAFLKTTGYDVDSAERDAISFRAAESQFENGNYQRAIDQYTSYISKYPNGQQVILAHYRRGDAYSQLKLFSNALLDYEYVINRGQSRYYPKALEKAALIAYNSEQDFRRAYKHYVKLEEIADNEQVRLVAQVGALRSAYRAGLTSEVLGIAGKVANNRQASPEERAQANFYLGKVAYDRKDYGKALSAFNQVVATSDNEQTAEARYLIAYIHYLQRDLDKAQEVAINSNRESSSYPYWVAKSVILLADILTEKGDLFNAQATLEALLEHYDGDKDLIASAQEKLNVLNKRIEGNSRIESSSDEMIFDEGGNNN